MTKARLLLVDDHQILRAGLRALFERQEDVEVVGEAASAPEAIALVRSSRPTIVLLDLTLPDGGGMAVLQALKAGDVPCRALVLTMHDDPAYARAALAAGATGYVVKTVSERDLLAAVRAVGRGQVFVDLDDEARTASVFAQAGGRAVAGLSGREEEILRLLGQGFTNLEIADRLELSPKTVATYKARIGEKLGLKTTSDFVRYATETGLLGS